MKARKQSRDKCKSFSTHIKVMISSETVVHMSLQVAIVSNTSKMSPKKEISALLKDERQQIHHGEWIVRKGL